MANDLLGFFVIAGLVIVTPGQDTALTIRNSLRGGRRGGVATALGVAAGQATWTVAAGGGLVALLAASETAFAALRLAGAAYLVWLGAQALVGSLGRRHPRVAWGKAARPSGAHPGAAFRQGLISNLGNPKMAVFFTSLLPQFAAPGGAFVSPFLLGLAFCSMTLAWLSAYAVAVARAGDFMRASGVRRVFEAVMGATLVGFGLRLALESR